jgi:D-serine deaminase-like pyridoxal phosphate-dependent protein
MAAQLSKREIGMNPLAELHTPCALVDTARLQHNIARMQQRIHGLGVAFRPHVKTSKSWPVVQAQIAAGARGITVSTLKEAEQFFANGVQDILYAVGMVPSKLPQAAALLRRGCALKLLADSPTAAQAIVAYGREQGLRFEVLLEIDTDGHRSGIRPEQERLIEVGCILHEGGMALAGVMTHAGASYSLNTPEALEAMAEQERSRCVAAAERLRAAGLPCPIVSVGSTPTALSARSLPGVTEVRAGVYVFFDLVMANVGVCRIDDVALSVLTTVIGHQADKGWAIIDAGWMAMSRDRGTQAQAVDYGYGQVCDETGRVLAGYTVSGANQEHGIVSHMGGVDAAIEQTLPVGTRLRILPNHACATGAQFSEYHAVAGAGSDDAVQVWPRFSGW